MSDLQEAQREAGEPPAEQVGTVATVPGGDWEGCISHSVPGVHSDSTSHALWLEGRCSGTHTGPSRPHSELLGLRVPLVDPHP